MHDVPSSDGNGMTPAVIEMDTLIVGAGPAGGALASFLAFHGVKGLMITNTSSTADTPRAHITNAAAIECLRDIGLEDQVTRLSNGGEIIEHMRWSNAMNGREYGRIFSWGKGEMQSKYDKASPCRHFDLPQTLLEPVLVQYATQHGFNFRFDTEFLSFADHGDHVISTLRDMLTNATYQVRSRFLFGADGGRSRIVKQLDLPMYKQPSHGTAINVLADVDLSHLMTSPGRTGHMNAVFQPELDAPPFARHVYARMIQPWKEWLFGIIPDPGYTGPPGTSAQLAQRIRDAIGQDVPITIKSISKWHINEVCAETFSRGNVFCLGDAVHRHPPVNGLGSNTCIQDAYNLAWKAAFVLQGKAGPALMESFSTERVPVGMAVVRRANDGYRVLGDIVAALGFEGGSMEERRAAAEELEAATPAGRARRQRLQKAFEGTRHEYQGLGVEMNQVYAGSGAVCVDGVAGDDGLAAVADPLLDYAPSTYPGRRLPHVWLSRPVPDEALVSTHDVAGKGRFTLFTGIGGEEAWGRAAAALEEELGVGIRMVGVGYGLEFHDPYFEWARMRGVEEDGCVLVRPDRFVGWRAERILQEEGGEEWAEGMLRRVLRSILAK